MPRQPVCSDDYLWPIVDALAATTFIIMIFSPPGALGLDSATRDIRVLAAIGLGVLPAGLFATSAFFGFEWNQECREAEVEYRRWQRERREKARRREREPGEEDDGTPRKPPPSPVIEEAQKPEVKEVEKDEEPGEPEER